MLFTSQALEVVKNSKNSICFLSLLKLIPYKFLFDQYYPKALPNPDILIICLPKNDELLELTEFLFLTLFPIFAMESSYITMHCWGNFQPQIFFKYDCHHIFSLDLMLIKFSVGLHIEPECDRSMNMSFQSKVMNITNQLARNALNIAAAVNLKLIHQKQILYFSVKLKHKRSNIYVSK